MKEPEISAADVDAIHRAMEVAQELQTYVAQTGSTKLDKGQLRVLALLLEELHTIASMIHVNQDRKRSIEARRERNHSIERFGDDK